MNKSTKIVISAIGASIAGLCAIIPVQSFRDYDPALGATLYGLVVALGAYLLVWPWVRKK
jgi:hypothetical protein